METTTTNSAFRRGLAGGAPFLLVVGPFGLLFGVVGTEAGLDLAQVMGFSVLVIAGASQFTALHLMTEQTPVLIVLATALAVNLRMAMYSASLVPHLGAAPLWQRALVAYAIIDQSYAVSIESFQRAPDMTPSEKIRFFFGTFMAVAPAWYGMTWIGAVAGAAIPPEFALDFAVPVTFMALVAPALRTLPHMLAALVSTLAALAFAWIPYGLGLILAAILAMATGAIAETLLEKRR